MTVHIVHTLAGLDRDMRALPVKASRETAKIVRDNAKLGNRKAKALAKESAGKHGKHYHKAFTAEAIDPFTWEYGPDESMPQGDMSFEYGSVKQSPHLDLNKSADLIEFQLHVDVRDMLKGLFW